MTSNFHSEEEHEPAGVSNFRRDGVVVNVTNYAGQDYAGATTVFTSGHSEVFHADKYCHRLYQGETSMFDGEEQKYINARTLESVITTWLDPVKPCSYCTQDINKTAEIAQKYDKVPESYLKFFEPGDQRVSTVVRTTPDGETVVSESSSEVY